MVDQEKCSGLCLIDVHFHHYYQRCILDGVLMNLAMLLERISFLGVVESSRRSDVIFDDDENIIGFMTGVTYYQRRWSCLCVRMVFSHCGGWKIIAVILNDGVVPFRFDDR